MIDLLGLTVDGVSIGGVATCIDLPELKVCVDVGRLLDRTVARNTVLITHGHADHVGALAQHVAQRGLRRLPAATYVVPPGLDEDLEDLLRVWRRMDRGALEARIETCTPGEEWPLRRDLVARPFRTRHRVVSQGYVIEELRGSLAPEFEGAAPETIRDARLAGTEVTRTTRVPIVAVTGDTTIEGIVENEDVMRARRLVMEATFLDDRISRKGARERGHVHLDDVAAIAGELECEALLLNHVSPRHSREDAVRLVRERLPEGLALRTQVMVSE